MASQDTTALKSYINSFIKSNGVKAITGPIMNTSLIDIVDSMYNKTSDSHLVGLRPHDAAKIYNTGDTVIYLNDIYSSNIDSNTGAWNAANWTKLVDAAGDLPEFIDDRVAALIQNGTGITWVYDDGAGTLTPTIGGLTITEFASTNVSQWTNDAGYATSAADIGLGNVENTALSTWAGSANITTVGTISTGTWNGSTIAIANGGTGQTTAQAAINALTQVSGATDEYVLTKDTTTGDAIWKAGGGGVSFGVNNEIPITNATANDFDYDSKFTYDGTTLKVQGATSTSNAIEAFNASNYTRLFSGGLIANINGVATLKMSNVSTLGYYIQSETTGKSLFLATENKATSTSGRIFHMRPNGDIDLGAAYNGTTYGAALGVRGKGSTDATTGFVVKDSANTTIFEVKDGGTVEVNGSSLGNVSNTGTPANDQLAVWTNANTVEGSSQLIYQSGAFQVASGGGYIYLYNSGYMRMKKNTTANTLTFDPAFGNQTRSQIATSAGADLFLQSGIQAPIYLDTSGNVSVGQNKALGTTHSARFEITGSGATAATIGLNVRNSSAATNFKVQDDGVSVFKSFTVATLPTAVAGGYIYVSDETGGATMAFSDGTNWRRVQDRAIVS